MKKMEFLNSVEIKKLSLKDMVKDFIKTVGGKVLFIAIPGCF